MLCCVCGKASLAFFVFLFFFFFCYWYCITELNRFFFKTVPESIDEILHGPYNAVTGCSVQQIIRNYMWKHQSV